jgi:hypothetical protein
MQPKFYWVFICLGLTLSVVRAQELFLFTYPASNVPKNALVLRGMNSFFNRTADNTVSYHFMPELEYGITKNWMIVTNGFLSNEDNRVNLEGGSFFTQYRFYAHDMPQKHFRMAAWSRIALNTAKIHQEEIELNGHNSGIRIGLTSTSLLHRTAISGTISYQKAFNNFNDVWPQAYGDQSVDYTLSIGHLFLPTQYKSFNQTNVNFMLELLGQTHTLNTKTFIDVSPVLQFIFKSRARLDIAYRRQLYNTLYRTQPNGVILNFQYSLFNLF